MLAEEDQRFQNRHHQTRCYFRLEATIGQNNVSFDLETTC
jgi:hypothetical protein